MTSTEKRELSITLPSDCELEMKRVFNAPAAKLFEVWTKPEHVMKWYGVRSTTMTVCEMDVRVGGAWRWVSTMPNGMEIAFSGKFLALDPPHRLQKTEWFEAVPGAESVVTLTFEEHDGQTTLTAHMRFQNKRQRDICLKSGMELGVKECFENIDAILAGQVAA